MIDAIPSPQPFAVASTSARVRAAIGALAALSSNPGRLDQVLVLAQAVNAGALGRAIARIEQDPAGRALLQEQPRIDRTHVDFDALRALPEGTLGREYVRFFDDNAITPDVFEALPEAADPRAAYVMLRMRQTHDLWHVITGYRTDVHGEVLLQAFTYAQTGAPSAFVIAAFGTVRYGIFRWPNLRAELRRAYDHGRRAASFPTFRWEEHWATPVAELRVRLACPHVDALAS